MKAAVLGKQVAIKEDGAQKYPDGNGGYKARAKMHDDWGKEWRYRGRYPCIGLVRPGEAWVPGTIPTDVPSQVGDAANLVQTYMLGDGKLKTMHEVAVGTERFPAVLTKQWPDGYFEVTAFKTNNQAMQVAKYTTVDFPALHKSSIFLTSTGEAIALPECGMSLEVLRAAPQNAQVLISGKSFLEHLGRASPKASAGAPRRIVVDCPKQIRPDLARQMLRQNVLGMNKVEKPVEFNTHGIDLEHFLSGEVRRGVTTASRLKRCWTVQFGPFATHTLRLEKKNHGKRFANSVMTLYVDDEVLVECNSSDLGGSPDLWRCKFSFVGERQMDFKIFEETKDGWPLDSQSELTRCYQYRHVVEVTSPVRALDNLINATMTIDTVPFQGLPCVTEVHRTVPNLSITPSALKAQFGIEIPKKIAPQDTRGIARQLGSNAVAQAGGWGAIGEAATTTISDVGANLSKLGMSAWEMMFIPTPQRDLPVLLGVEPSAEITEQANGTGDRLISASIEQPNGAGDRLASESLQQIENAPENKLML
jgi:hypothetical protein